MSRLSREDERRIMEAHEEGVRKWWWHGFATGGFVTILAVWLAPLLHGGAP